jgi:ribonuclease HII
MRKFDKQYPEFKFAQHKGYATQIHRQAILKHGLTPIHRLSFCENFV